MSLIDKYFRNEIKEILVYLFLGILTPIIIPLFIGFAFLAFEESFVRGSALEFGSLLVTLLIYLIFTIATYGLIIYPITALLNLKRDEHPAVSSNPNFFTLFSVSYIFSPERGLLYKLFEGFGMSKQKNPARFLFSFFRVIALSVILFWAVGILQILNPSLQFIGIPKLQAQQVTVASDVAFTSLLPAWSETMTILFLLFFLLGITAYLTSKIYKKTKDKNLSLWLFFLLAIFVVSILIGFLWGGLHRIVYGSSDVAFYTTVVFGALGSIMTIVTGTFIPFWIWHLFNNIYARLSQLVVINEDLLVISIVLWAIFTLGYAFTEFYLFKRKKRGGNIPSEDNSF